MKKFFYILMLAVLGMMFGVVGCATTSSVTLKSTETEQDLRVALQGVNAVKEGPQPDGTIIRCQDARKMVPGQQTTEIARDVAQLEARAEILQSTQGSDISVTPNRINSYTAGISTSKLINESHGRFWACVRMGR